MSLRSVNIINVPSDVGSMYAGKSRAIAAFRSAGLQEQLQATGWQVTESTALSDGSGGWKTSTREPNGARNEEAVVKACRQVRDTLASALATKDGDLSSGNAPLQLILAGECLFCPAILSAFWERLQGTDKTIGIIYMDADCDLYTPTDRAGVGTIAGMTLTHLTLREGALESMKAFARPDGNGVVDNNNIALFGLNIEAAANTREHLGYLFDKGFHVTTSQSVQKHPVDHAKATLRWLEERVDYLLVHLDVDVIDPGMFPLCNVPNWTGLGFEEAMAAFKTFLGSEKLVGLSIAEVNPDHDPGLSMTKQLVGEIVAGLKEAYGHV
jgi:arginase